MMKRFLMSMLSVALLGFCGQADDGNRWKLDLGEKIDRWDAAVPLGNGIAGALVWGGGSEIRFSLDRGDLWDLRSPKELAEPGFTYANLQKLVKAGDQGEINRLFDNIYRQAVPTKLPGARLVLKLVDDETAQFSLDLTSGTGKIALKSGTKAEAFWVPGRPVMVVRVPAALASIELVPTVAMKGIGYPDAKITKANRSLLLEQPGLAGTAYAIGVVWKELPGGVSEIIVAFEAPPTGDAAATALATCQKAQAEGGNQLGDENAAWWKRYWGVSEIEIPDAGIRRLYDLAMYYYGAGSRQGAPPLPLQGVWTADAGGLPPWKGDYHHDMNTQVIYWAYYAAGHFSEGQSLLDFMSALAPVHRKFAKDFFGVDGLMVPGVMSFDGKPLGGWVQYALSPTMGPWLFQNYDWHWRYTQDRQFLASKAYPYGAEMAKAIEALLVPDAKGLLKLPLSSSPEIHNNSPKAWLTPNSTNDQAILLWFFGALSMQAEALDKADDAKHYREIRAKLGPLVVDQDGVLMLSPNERLRESHRHHAHLMAIQPLGLLSIEGVETERRIVLNSLDDLRRLGPGHWVGFSYPWAACLEARAGRGELVPKYLQLFADGYVSKNGFNLNDRGGGPFTLDANFAHALAVQEMLVQGWNGVIRLFPAMPWRWHEASFRNLRTEEGHVVSAKRENNATTWLRITAGKDGTLRLRDTFGDRQPAWNREGVRKEGRDFIIELKRGDTIEATLPKLAELPPIPDLAAQPLFLPPRWEGITDSRLPLRIGADSAGANGFVGDMAGIAIFSRPLDADEIGKLPKSEIFDIARIKGAVAVPGIEKMADGTLPNLANATLPVKLIGAATVAQRPIPDGKPLSVFRFTGNGCLELADDPSLQGKNGLTLAVWIRPAGPVPANGMRLIDKSVAGTAKGYLLDTFPAGKAIRLCVRDPMLTAKAELSIDQWTHVAITVDGQTGKQTLYLNGKKLADGW